MMKIYYLFLALVIMGTSLEENVTISSLTGDIVLDYLLMSMVRTGNDSTEYFGDMLTLEREMAKSGSTNLTINIPLRKGYNISEELLRDINIEQNTSELYIDVLKLLGNFHGSDSLGRVCTMADSSLIPLPHMHCFYKDELTNITQALYDINMFSIARLDDFIKIVFSLKILSEQTSMFISTDFLLFWKRLITLFLIVVDENFVAIVNNLLNSRFSNYSLYYILKSIQQNIVLIRADFTILNRDLLLKVWYPFRSGISGIALYENSMLEQSPWIEAIYMNQTSDEINLDNLKMAGYVPKGFLEKFPTKRKKSLYLVMIMVINGGKYNKVLELNEKIKYPIGVSIPKFCKKNHEPMLTAYFESHADNSERKWIEFGKEYFDHFEEDCFLSKMSYFGRFPPDSVGTMKAKIINACEEQDNQYPVGTFFERRNEIFDNISKDIDEMFAKYVQVKLNITLIDKKIPDLSSLAEELLVNLFYTFGYLFRDMLKTLDIKSTAMDVIIKLNIQKRRKIMWIISRFKFCFMNSILEHYKVRNDLYFETVKEEYCMEQHFSNGLYWRQAPINSDIYQENVCLDRNLLLPHQRCYPAGIFAPDIITLSPHMECSKEHPISNNTNQYYNIYIKCIQGNFDCTNIESILLDNALNYVDIVIAMNILVHTYLGNKEPLYTAYEKGLDFLEEQAVSKSQLSYLVTMSRLLRVDASITPMKTRIRRNYIQILFYPVITDVIGFAIYKRGEDSFMNYDIKSLTMDNATKTISDDDNVEVVVYVDCEKCLEAPHTGLAAMHAFIYYNMNFTENGKYSSISRLIGLENPVLAGSTRNVNLYLSTKEKKKSISSIYDHEEGHWFTITLPSIAFTLVSIVKPVKDVCDSTSKLLIHQTFMNGTRNVTQDGDATIKNILKLDFLSQLVVQVNVETRELHQLHSEILEITAFSLGIVSEMALLSIFITMVSIKNWHQKRLCSVQLSIATAGEITFFLMKDFDIGHVGYVIFYYFMLAQFAWMVVIGHVQYMRYIKIVPNYDVGLLKPLLFGWLVPLAITFGLIFSHLDCFKCSLCVKNASIFLYFIMIPVGIVIACNLGIYIYFLVNVSRDTSHMTPEVMKARLRAIIMLPFILGISWIFILAIIAPWPWLSLVGSYFFHIIPPSQGLILFVFFIIFDKNTTNVWINRFTRVVGRCIHVRSNTDKKD